MSEQIEAMGAGRGSLRGYVTGFVLSAAAVLQVLVHLRYFLHLDASSRMRWNVLALLFALLIMVLIVGGTLWIMTHLSYRLS